MKTLLLTLLLFPIFYFSQQDTNGWFLANVGVDGTKNYIKNLEKKSSDTFVCWVKMVSPVKKNKKGAKIGGGYSLQYWTVYCGENQYSVSEAVTYNSKGSPIDSYDRSYEGAKNVIPDSVAEGIIILVCDAGKLMQD